MRSKRDNDKLGESFFNKKGLSQVVGTLLMILLTIAAVASIWAVINSFVGDRLDDTKACYDVYDKVAINTQYTCYNASSNQTYLSIELKDIDIDSLIVAVSYGDSSTPFELKKTDEAIPDVLAYPAGTPSVSLPNKNAGKTYIINKAGIPQKITIAPKVNTKQCDASSSALTIPTCV